MKDRSEVGSASVKSLLRQGSKALSRGKIPEERMEAELFLAKVLGLRRIDLYLDPERPVKKGEQARFDKFILERLKRKPAQHLLEEQEFWGNRFWTPPGVFIPRPETELLVETAAELFSKRPPAKILDIGTGSGCLSVTLALLFTDATIFALDRSLRALSVARINAETHGVADRIAFFCSDLTGTIRSVPREMFDLIVSNPPYLADTSRTKPFLPARPGLRQSFEFWRMHRSFSPPTVSFCWRSGRRREKMSGKSERNMALKLEFAGITRDEIVLH